MDKGKKYTKFQFTGNFVAGYDRFNHIASFGMDILWRRKTSTMLCRQMLSQQIGRPLILDLACGTGDMALSLQRRCEQAIIVASDPSFEMLQLGVIKKTRYHSSIDFICAVERLPFKDSLFFAVTCAFGVRNFTHLESDLLEIYRLLKPGGFIFVLDFFVPRNKFILLLLRVYNVFFFPSLGWLLTGQKQPYQYLFHSIVRFISPEQFSALLTKIGFRGISAKKFFFGLAHVIFAVKPDT